MLMAVLTLLIRCADGCVSGCDDDCVDGCTVTSAAQGLSVKCNRKSFGAIIPD